MVTSGELLSDVIFLDEAAQNYAGTLVVDAELGFLRSPDTAGEGMIDLVGFGRPLRHKIGERWRDGHLTPVTTYDQLSDSDKDPRMLLKAGVASRVYNTAHALGNTAENPDEAPVWSFSIPRAGLFDERHPSDATLVGKVSRAATYAWRREAVKVVGLRAETDHLHRRYGAFAAVLFNEPPKAEIRQLFRGNTNKTDLRPAFIAIRSAGVTLRLIGTWHKPTDS
jgi:hypothetical protein